MAELTVQEQLIARAIKDPAFRQEVLSDPKKVLANQYNVQLPEDITVRVLEDAPNMFSIILPAEEDAVQELSDADLEAVAGGDSLTITCTYICLHWR